MIEVLVLVVTVLLTAVSMIFTERAELASSPKAPDKESRAAREKRERLERLYRQEHENLDPRTVAAWNHTEAACETCSRMSQPRRGNAIILGPETYNKMYFEIEKSLR